MLNDESITNNIITMKTIYQYAIMLTQLHLTIPLTITKGLNNYIDKFIAK